MTTRACRCWCAVRDLCLVTAVGALTLACLLFVGMTGVVFTAWFGLAFLATGLTLGRLIAAILEGPRAAQIR